MYNSLFKAVASAKTVVVIQPENPDGDSLASALALETLFTKLGVTTELFCAIDMPKYLRYIDGWDRVSHEWTGKYDLALIVDTATETLLEKALSTPGVRHYLEHNPVFVLDHHVEADEGDDLSFPHTSLIDQDAAATSELLYKIALEAKWKIDQKVAEYLFISIASDTLGMSTPSASLQTFETVTELVRLGVKPSDLEQRRREYMRKPADILAYKGDLISRIAYHCDGKLAVIHVPWADIAKYSDRYNPSVLVLDEMRLVDDVDVAVAIKTYPDGKLTGKIRANKPIAESIAGYFGGGGHAYSAGFKVHESYDEIIPELITAFTKAESTL